MADKIEGLIISEILADNAGNAASDTDGDGSANKADEFVEIQNTSNSTVSLDGFELWSEKVGLLYAFGASDTIAGGQTATVVAEYTGTPPPGFYDSGESNNVNWLPDGEGQKFDSIFLVNRDTGEYVVLSYGDPPRTPTLPGTFPGTARIGAGEAIDSNSPNGVAFARNTDGDFVETSPDPGTPGVPCFCPGTMISTDQGPVAVEDLKPGMLLWSRDAGFVPLRAVRRAVISAGRANADPTLWPILLTQGVLSLRTAIKVSPNHRFLLNAPQASLLFGAAEVLVAAKHLIGDGAVQMNPQGKPLTYYHLLLDTHTILMAQGIWTESLFLGDATLDHQKFLTLWDVMPGIDLSAITHATTARPVLAAYEAKLLLQVLRPSALRRTA